MAGPERIYLARHGETEWNAVGRIQGRLDSPLTSRGIAHGERLGEFVRAERIAMVVSSPLGRAKRTAELAVQASGVPLVLLDELAEIDHGRFSGLTKLELGARHPGALVARARDKFRWVHPDGESYESALPRARTAVAAIAATSAERVLVVSHEMIGRLLRMELLGLTPAEAMGLSQPHATVIEVVRGDAVEHHLVDRAHGQFRATEEG